MVNFFGEFRASLDSKNRIMIPSRFREIAGNIRYWILTRGLDNCLALYTPDRWDEVVKSVTEISFTKKKARDFQRLLFSKAVQVDVDKNGRILLPEYLKKIGGLQKKIVFAGVADRIELWEEETWDQRENELSDDFETLAEDLFD